jgi:hypothetical protein
MKNYLCILAAAALLASCGDKTTETADTASPSPPANENVITAESKPVVVTDEKSGSFTVDARSDFGATFQNASATQATFEFNAKGQWSFAAAAGMFGPDGAGAPAGPNFILPGAGSFALVAKRDDGTVQSVGKHGTLTLKPKETVSFAMNEVPGSFGDNRGSLIVDWTKK